MNTQLEISVIIETLNYERGDERNLAGVLKALQQQTIARDRIEVIVVIDPIKDPELRVRLEALDPAARAIEAPHAHYYAQKNRGAEEARADVIGFLDSDCRPCSTWVETILRRLRQSGAELAAVQGAVITDRTTQGLAFALTAFAQVQGREPRDTAMLTGNNCAFRRSEFMRAPFDETPWFHGSEVKMICALRHSGRRVLLEPGAEVVHAFYPGISNFLVFSAYWGWCFLHLRRGAPLAVPYAKLFDRLGWLAPLVLGPAKMVMDTWRLLQQRRNMNLGWFQALRCCLFLYAMAPAIAYGGVLERLGLNPPTPLY